ncbi:MAG: o-succinylbenzoate synthase, partial [Flavobacteriia bacterium]|nr:o-succinylbenzoate synthase [Flavobacteriia bacterium]
RVDANGAFSFQQALNKLNQLSAFELHSIEQPIAPGQWEGMAELCQKSPLPIALDEELIGVYSAKDKQEMLSTVKPHYLILKPSLLGGFSAAEEWIACAESQQIGWWVTSALESNLALNALAQWTYSLGVNMPQGLGTGSLYVDNIQGPLYIDKGCLGLSKSIPWQKEL